MNISILENTNFKNKTNLVLLINNKEDINNFKSLNLGFSDLFSQKISSLFSENKNTIFKFYYWKDSIDEVIFLFYLDKTKNVNLFLWEYIKDLPNDISFYYKNDNILLDSIILWKYSYDKYKSDKKDIKINIILDKSSSKKVLNDRLNTLNNITNCRDLVNCPAEHKTPDKYLDLIKSIDFKNTKVKVLDYDEIVKEWLWLIEAVWKWSHFKPKLVILERVVDEKLPTHWLVWKWITFDTWGLNIKVWDYMYWMKDDMAWSASLLYTMKELDDKDISCNLVCALPLVENSISWDSFRPGDIITSYIWKTVEIINTDAEWRLILADWVGYISKNYKLDSITTIATLTWACMVAIWYNYWWIMWTNRDFIDSLLKNETFEDYWELPFSDFFVEKTKWEISDLKNLSEWIFAWASVWWAFMYNFCTNNELYTHIDIAWVAFVKEKYWLYNKWATWFWVDSLSKMFLWI